jgi:predicted transcriptional regulator
MTKLLDAAIAKVQALPEDVQDEAAEVLFTIASRSEGPITLDAETRAAILEGLAQVRRGEFASAEEIERLFRPPPR